jgi:hypothetical protein
MLSRVMPRLVVSGVLLWFLSAVPASAQLISTELEASQVTVTNDVAEVTFKVVVRNDEALALTNVWLVFEEGFEISIGDIEPESSRASESTTHTFDLTHHVRSRTIPLNATLKYTAGGEAVEQTTSVGLHLQE